MPVQLFPCSIQKHAQSRFAVAVSMKLNDAKRIKNKNIQNQNQKATKSMKSQSARNDACSNSPSCHKHINKPQLHGQ